MAKIDWEKINLDVLNRLDIRSEAEGLGVNFTSSTPNPSGWLPCHAIDREDKNPSAAICVSGANGALGRYTDNGGDGLSLSFWGLAAEKGPWKDWEEARHHFAEKAGVTIPKKKSRIDGFKEQAHLQPINKYPGWERYYKRFMERKSPITLESIEAAGALQGTWHRRSPEPFSVIAFLAYRKKGDDPSGIVLYQSNGQPFPAVEGKLPERKSHNLRGSKDGWIPVGGWSAIEEAETIWVAEGVPDALALYPLLPPGHAVVTNICGADGKKKLPLGKFKNKRVLVVGDADQPGKRGAEKFASAVVGKAGDVRLVTLPFEITEDHGKDLRDFIKDGGTFEQLQKIAEDAEPVAAVEKPKRKRRAARRSNGDELVKEDGAIVLEENDDPHRLARLCKRVFQALVFYRSEFFRFDSVVYQPIENHELQAIVTASIKSEFDLLYLISIENWQPTSENPFPPPAMKVTKSLVGNVVQALQSISLVSSKIEQPAWLDTNDAPFPADEVMATRSGLLHLPGFVEGREPFFVSPTPSFFSTNSLDYDFKPDASSPSQFLKFLKELWPDDKQSIETLQEWMGYILLPDTTQQKILFLLGPKRSGKGTMARTMRSLIGPKNVAGPMLSSLAKGFGLWPLIGKTLAIISDARLSGSTDMAIVERLLSISGEDAITVDRKFKSLVTTTLKTRFMILTNEYPKLQDSSGALASRMIVLRLRESFFGREDRNLTEKLLKELPGILLWAIEGLRRLRERGYFVQPESSADIVAEMEDLTSPILKFVRERCVLPHQLNVLPFEKLSVAKQELFEAWKRWCHVEGIPTDSKSLFGRNLHAAVPSITNSQHRDGENRVPIYVGIGLRSEIGTG